MPRKNLVNLRVGAVQMYSRPDDVPGNLAKAEKFCDRAARRGVKILCFPECASTGWDVAWLRDKRYRSRFYAEPVPGLIVDRLAAKAAETDMYIIFGVVEKSPKPRSRKIYNTAVVVGPSEGYMGKQRKVFAEAVFEDGTDANVFDTRYGRIGLFICADQRSPELARLLACKGAHLLFQPTYYSARDCDDIKEIKRSYIGKCTAQRSRAMDNGLHLIAANGGRPEFVNNSRIIGPGLQGPEPVLARATRREQLLVADLEYDLNYNNPREKARRAPWLFRELGREMTRLGRTVA
jgi:predicted amidohydrolase